MKKIIRIILSLSLGLIVVSLVTFLEIQWINNHSLGASVYVNPIKKSGTTLYYTGGNMGVGSSTVSQLFQVVTGAGNATTTLQFGADGASNSKGVCINMENDAGAIYHLWIDNNSLTTTVGACS